MGHQASNFSPDLYVPVDIRTLDGCGIAMCDLYRFTSQHGYVLFLSRDAEFAESVRDQLVITKARRLYIRAEEANVYAAYITSRVLRAVDDSSLGTEEKAAIAYQAVQFLVDRILEHPRADTLGNLKEGVRATVGLALRDPAVPAALMAHTRQGTYVYNHAVNVGVFGTALALQLRPEPEWLNSVAVGLFLHDIGKSRIPREILAWPGPYSAAHWALMKQHPGLGLVVLNDLQQHDPIVRAIVVQHHERSDGSGYPKGLRGDKISMEARICTIADVFDALTTKRTYRDQAGTYEALDRMIREMSSEFETRMFSTFIQLFGRETQP